MVNVFFFFFKQKTAYEMRISDWSSDVCSSDLTPVTNVPPALLQGLSIPPAQVLKNQQAYIAVYESQDDVTNVVPDLEQLKKLAPLDLAVTAPGDRQIGRASCRERVCQYV